MSRYKSRQSFRNQESRDNSLNERMRQLGRKSFFQSVLVYEFISNPDLFKTKNINTLEIDPTEDPDQKLVSKIKNNLQTNKSKNLEELYKNEREVKNVIYFDIMPANSIIGYNLQNSEESLEVFFPFFPHMSLPIKPGEVVWVFYDETAGRRLGYWVSRKCGTRFTEDLNYTDNNRQTFIASLGKDSSLNVLGGITKKDYQDLVYSFGQHLNFESGLIDSKQNSDTIAGTSLSYNEDFKGSCVPRYTRKSSDLVLQGSNNTLINLTNDSNSELGKIELVVGRGKNLLKNPGKVKNNRSNRLSKFEYEELDKTYTITDKLLNFFPEEGVPDEESDAVHVYFKEDNPNPGLLNATNEYSGHINLRVNTNTNDHSMLKMVGSDVLLETSTPLNPLTSATIELESKKIYLGNSARNENDPYVKYSTLKPLLDKIINSILVLQSTTSGEAFAGAAATMISAVAMGVANPVPLVNTVLNSFSGPALLAATTVNQQTTIGVEDLAQTGNAISSLPLGSTKVFGE